jgi:hypothetical protein
MQPLHTPGHSLHGAPTFRNDPLSMRELPAEDGLDRFASRCEPQMLVARAKHTDPYAAWLNQREAECRSATATAVPSPVGRFGRKQLPKAPWGAIRVTLSPDVR